MACQRKDALSQQLAVDCKFTPQPPHVGPTTVTFAIADGAKRPIVGAHVTTEADMSHPGMSPVFADAKEIAPGRYQSTILLRMAGDWVVLLHGSLPNGDKFERQFDLRGVRAN
ncbi:MAG TPA: FixH family protein [Candidatus Sulfotelmatobacter sp.]|nr:FixH family protein [Candidatus Sulfotelmatobacter sp.]